MYCLDRSVSQPFLANNGVSYGPIMTTLNAKLCVLMAFWIAARRSPSVYVANLTLMPGYCFANLELVSGIIWSVISGLDTTATVTVPELLLVLPPEPPLEQAASAASAATQPRSEERRVGKECRARSV